MPGGRSSGLVALAILLATPLAAQQPITDQHVTIRLVPELAAVAANSRIGLAIDFEIDPGWHIYFAHPGQSGIATRIRWQLPSAVTVDSLRWPVPSREVTEGLVTHVYRGHAVLFTTLHIGATQGPLHLRASVTFGACETQCVQGKAEVSLDLPVGVASQNPEWQRFLPLYTELPAAVTGLSAHATISSGILLLRLSPARAVPPSAGPLTFFPLDTAVLDTCVVAPIARSDDGYTISLGKPNGTPKRLRGIVTGWAGRALRVEVEVGR